MDIREHESYKNFHEKYMQNLNGTTVFETVSAFSIVPVSVVVVVILPVVCETVRTFSKSNIFIFAIEYIILVLPQILMLTIFNNAVNIVGYAVVAFILVIVAVHYKTTKYDWLHFYETQKQFVTNFRASMILVTAICILAVDFTSFPRRFAKTETFGYGLMDTGVGGFVFSNAVVSHKAHGTKLTISVFSNIFISNSPLIILGMLRYLTTSQVDYQQHVSEYGVHWNFFLTLAFTRIFCTTLMLFLSICRKYPLQTGILVIVLHQTLLTCGLEKWIFSDVPRTDFLSANREGIMSIPGYIALYFVGVHVNQMLFLNSECSYNILLGRKLIKEAVIFWICTAISNLFFGVSRRSANLGYFMWLSAYNITFLLMYLFVDMFILFLIARFLNKDKQKESVIRVPVVLQAISYNGLTFFLLSNLLTGLINISMHTLKLCVVTSILLLNVYMIILSAFTFILFVKKIKLKIW